MTRYPGRSSTYGHDGRLLGKTKPAAPRGGERPRSWKEEPDSVDKPEPGFWLLRMCRNGPLVPARIYLGSGMDEDGQPLDRPLQLCGEVADLPIEALEIWTRRKRPIPEADFRYRTDTIKWARQHKPNLPECHPWKPIDLTNLPPIAELAE